MSLIEKDKYRHPTDELYEHTLNYRLFQPGAIYPPVDSIDRIAKYERGRQIYRNKAWEVYQRASDILKDTPHAAQLQKLYMAVALADILVTKPADLLVGDPPNVESGKPDNSIEQKRINAICEGNNLAQLIHESTIGNGYRGDAWLKVRYNYRQDFSELEAIGQPRPASAKMEPIIEPVKAKYVFPELSRGSAKRFKAVNIAWVEWVESKDEELPFLNVERHLPGLIIYERFTLEARGIDADSELGGTPIETFTIREKVPTGRKSDIVETGVPEILVHHIAYKATDETWQGESAVEKLETLFAAVNDRLVQIDYILWKHSDPTFYGPELDGVDGNTARFGGVYIPVTKEDHTPGAVVWNGQLDAAFKELDYLIGLIYQTSETPQWLFGTTLAGNNAGGTGTSHTDSAAIKDRFMPIISKVRRIRAHVDKAVRRAIYNAQQIENYANEGVDGFTAYEPVVPTINWKDGLPRNDKELADIMSLRTGGKPTIDVHSAIKELDEVDDMKASQIEKRIAKDEEQASGRVDSSIFNAQVQPKVNGNGTTV